MQIRIADKESSSNTLHSVSKPYVSINFPSVYRRKHHRHHHKHQGLDQLDPFRLQSYNCSRQRFFGFPIVLFPCGL